MPVYAYRPKFKLCHQHQSKINCVAFSFNGAYLSTGGEDGLLVIWCTSTGKAKYRVDTTASPKRSGSRQVQTEPPKAGELDLPPNVPYLPGQASESDSEASMEETHEERKGRRGLGARVSRAHTPDFIATRGAYA